MDSAKREVSMVKSSALVLLFLIVVALCATSCTKPPGGDKEVVELRRELKEIKEENTLLRKQVAKLQAELVGKKQVQSGKATPRKRAGRFTREEFRKLLMGKTKDEVLATIGKPTSTGHSGSDEFWYYDNKCYDPISGKPDYFVPVQFRGNVVVDIDF
jgi:outer membrane protein assembly factor BamE (lipoprotein component of BamABCDE complex)